MAQRKATHPEQTTTRLPVVVPRPRLPIEESPDYRRARQLQLDASTCRWQAKGIRCVRPAVEVMEQRDGLARSACETHVLPFLRTGYRRLR